MIDGGQRGLLALGMPLTAKFRGAEYGATVVAEEGKPVRYRLDDGREFRSPSATGSTVMGGTACNGWRFWSIAAAGAEQKPVRGPGRRSAR